MQQYLWFSSGVLQFHNHKSMGRIICALSIRIKSQAAHEMRPESYTENESGIGQKVTQADTSCAPDGLNGRVARPIVKSHTRPIVKTNPRDAKKRKSLKVKGFRGNREEKNKQGRGKLQLLSARCPFGFYRAYLPSPTHTPTQTPYLTNKAKTKQPENSPLSIPP
jgi:hypothetical protein